MPRPRGHKLIVWDLDDVLCCFTEAWLHQAWKREHPGCTRAYGDLRSHPPLRELDSTRAEYLASIDRFRLAPAARDIPANPTLLAWFERAGGRFRHAVLTARPLGAVAPAAAWVFTRFGRWVRDFHFVPSRRPDVRLPHYETTKLEVLRRLGRVDFFVDDARENVAAAAASGIRAFLFPQPWNPEARSLAAILADIEGEPRRPGRPRPGAGRARPHALPPLARTS